MGTGPQPLRVASVQMSMTADLTENLAAAEAAVRAAAADRAQVILLPELFSGLYFCVDQDADHLLRALPVADDPAVNMGRRLAAELAVVLPISIFERAGNNLYNTVVMIDADGEVLGRYRKSHIPDGPGYCEKFYFTPGDTGFVVWNTRYAPIGVGICWDQWFPEAARAMALGGAELLLYPTAIGSEPEDPDWDSRPHWQRVMQGHAAANLMPVVAANRCGTEQGRHYAITFYGSSFMTDGTGEIMTAAGPDTPEILIADYDLAALRAQRLRWGLFRDRRPELYGALTHHSHPQLAPGEGTAP